MWLLLLILTITLLWISPALRQSVARLIDPDDRRPIEERSRASEPSPRPE